MERVARQVVRYARDADRVKVVGGHCGVAWGGVVVTARGRVQCGWHVTGPGMSHCRRWATSPL